MYMCRTANTLIIVDPVQYSEYTQTEFCSLNPSICILWYTFHNYFSRVFSLNYLTPKIRNTEHLRLKSFYRPIVLHWNSFHPAYQTCARSVFGGICRQTPTMHMINICEPLQAISVKVQVITPWWILCDPKHVGVIINYVSFKLLYNIDFNINFLYNCVH